MAKPTVHSHELRIFYTLVLLIALYGQSTGASSWLIPVGTPAFETALLWLLVLAFVAVLELGAVVLLRRAETQRQAGRRAWVTMLAAVALALGAAAVTWVAHWGPELSERIQAFAFAGSTLLGVLVWALLSDLSISETVARYRAVRAAIKRYIKQLAMDEAEKAVLLATLDIPFITRYITEGPEAVSGMRAHPRNGEVAEILAVAIAPATWHGAKPAPKLAPAEPVATPKPAPQERKPRPGKGRVSKVDWDLIAKTCEELRIELGRLPSARELADATPYGKSTTAKFLKANT